MAEAVEFDTAAFEASLRDALSKLKLKSDEEAERLAYDIANRAKKRAPVETGRLRASIDVQAGQDEAGKFFDVGTPVVYAPRIEFGFIGTDSLGRNYNQPPNPFMRSSILEAVEAWHPVIKP